MILLVSYYLTSYKKLQAGQLFTGQLITGVFFSVTDVDCYLLVNFFPTSLKNLQVIYKAGQLLSDKYFSLIILVS